MGASSSKMYNPSDARAAEIDDMALATNVVVIPYSIILENKKFNQEPPVSCRGCKAALNMYSVLQSAEHYYQKMQQEPQNDIERAEEEKGAQDGKFLKGKYVKDLKPEEIVWVCEFCEVHNRLPVDTVLPTEEKAFYLLRKAKQDETKTEEGETKTTEETKEDDDETNLIYCIDISGSMSCTHEVLVNEKPQFVERITLIINAIKQQLREMKETHPNRKVGLVLFGSTVTMMGDCSQNKIEINDSNTLNHFEKILNIGLEGGETLVTKALKDNADTLQLTLSTLNTSGCTALGPGLLSALTLAMQGKRGSKIILCTDGLSNVGLGTLESANKLQEAQEFYQRVGDLAVGKGVSISIITVQGQACKVDALAPLTDRTAGQILRVNPANLDLKVLASTGLIATDVKIRGIIHEGLAFKNERAEHLHNNNSILFKDIGPVSNQNQAYFEYRVKATEELQESGVNLDELEYLPLQAQITYTDLQGNEFALIVTRKQELTKDQNEAEKGIKADILAAYAEKQSAHLILEGKADEAKKKNEKWSQHMEKLANNADMNENNKAALEVWKAQNQQMQVLMERGNQAGALSVVEQDEITSQLYAIKQKANNI